MNRSQQGTAARLAIAWASRIGLALASTALAVLVLEAAFRLVPASLPAGTYGSGRRHPELGVNVHGVPLVYNKVRRVVREPNSEGFLDVEHARRKPPGTVRVGFFGDSYVEAAQVSLEETFFRRFAVRMGDERIEPLAFGLSGWGGLQSLHAYRLLGPRYDLDVVVYVFVENDLGDEVLDIALPSGSARPGLPFAVLAPGGRQYREQWVRLPPEEGLYGALKLLQRHSVLANVVRNRLSVLVQRGVDVRPDTAAREMTERAGGVPDPNDLPDTWPDRYRRLATRVGELVLADWKAEAERQSAQLRVLYVPRGEGQLRGDLPLESTWWPWLAEVCDRLEIPLIDPSPALRRRLDAGESVYHDHWTPEGHQAAADALAMALADLTKPPVPAPAAR